MQHIKNYAIRDLYLHHMRHSLFDPPHKVMELATAAISFLEAWEAENPTYPPQVSVSHPTGQGETLKAMPEIRPDDYRWFVHAPGKGWEEIDPDPKLIARQAMVENDAFGESPSLTEEERSKIEAEIYKEEK